jgi:hypothetical protein
VTGTVFGRGAQACALVSATILVGIAALTLGPLYLLPLIALVAWYAIMRIAAKPSMVLVWIALYSLLGDKMIVSTGIGEGQGLLRFGPLLSVVLLAAMLLVDNHTRMAARDVVNWGTPAVLFAAAGAVLPVLGVMSGSPVRTITAAIPPLAMGASLVFGVLIARSEIDPDRGRYLVLLTVSWAAAAVAALLFLFNRGIVLPLAREFNQWGVATAQAHGNTWLIGRTSGVYTSPNVLAILGGLTLLFAVFGRLVFRQRVALAIPAFAILFVTQSRTVIFATGVAIVIGAIFGKRRPGLTRWRTMLGWALVVMLVAAALIGASAVFPQYVESLTGRITAAVRIFSEGPQADRNFAGRVAFWKSAWTLFQQRPLGTLGPPELALGTAVDNDYLRFIVQGGILYAGMWIFYVTWLVTTGLAHGDDRFIGAGGIFLALTALALTPSTYVMVIGVFSLFVGMHIEHIRRHNLEPCTRHHSQETGAI